MWLLGETRPLCKRLFSLCVPHTDGAVLQDCGRKLSVGNEWENKVRLALNAQTQGKAYFSSNYWAKAESTANNRLKVWQNRSTAEYVVASWLMANDGASAVYANVGMFGDAAFASAVGHPLEQMRPMGTHVWLRTFTNAVVIVNAGSAHATVHLNSTFTVALAPVSATIRLVD